MLKIPETLFRITPKRTISQWSITHNLEYIMAVLVVNSSKSLPTNQANRCHISHTYSFIAKEVIGEGI